MLQVGVACLVCRDRALTHLLPSSLGTRVASFIVGGQDRWESGALMMEADNPESLRLKKGIQVA
ncbi:hypothetical protein AA15237_0460 [Komagataeibacter xylinus NBRC 15237]|uniref:hypothetical protein n=1 Tax=Komagataeibacter xylinus TaxID=28448 RepID=UPI000A8CAE88|nr:hypothetical protein [Komagataeibacter rhaeticus]GBQ68729.1 hypothetical protein AA15237_0460 [Komagataeibacter xylinus NBRC 15237]